MKQPAQLSQLSNLLNLKKDSSLFTQNDSEKNYISQLHKNEYHKEDKKMTLREVTDTASVLIGKKIDITTANKIVWECLTNLTALYSSACKIGHCDMNCIDLNTYFEVPSNCGIIRVIFESSEYKGYEYNELGIRFLDKGIFTIYYYDATIADIEESVELPINQRYHMEICKYLAFSILQIADPSSRVADKLIEEFFDNTKAIDKSMDKKKRFCNVIATRAWR